MSYSNNLPFAQHICAVYKSCFHNISDLRRIRNTLDQTTACSIATSLIHSKIDYSNSLLLSGVTTAVGPPARVSAGPP